MWNIEIDMIKNHDHNTSDPRSTFKDRRLLCLLLALLAMHNLRKEIHYEISKNWLDPVLSLCEKIRRLLASPTHFVGRAFNELYLTIGLERLWFEKNSARTMPATRSYLGANLLLFFLEG